MGPYYLIVLTTATQDVIYFVDVNEGLDIVTVNDARSAYWFSNHRDANFYLSLLKKYPCFNLQYLKAEVYSVTTIRC